MCKNYISTCFDKEIMALRIFFEMKVMYDTDENFMYNNDYILFSDFNAQQVATTTID